MRRLEMNFTASIYRREDRNWGSLMPDGSINGMISSLVKGEADLVATSLTMKPYRHSGCDFLVCSLLQLLAVLSIVQGDASRCFKPLVDFDVKVAC